MLKNIFPGIPNEYRANFLHLYMDIGWYAVLAGSSVNFLNVYAARLGASAFQIGLLGGMGAFINLLLAIPAGRWLEKRPIDKAIFWTAAFYRLGFLAWVFLPWFFAPSDQVWALILINMLMSVPLTALGVGFNMLFASAVPTEWRAQVAGVRNVTQAVVFMLTSLLSGYILERTLFPGNYQIIFVLGFIGAAMSTLHLYFIRPLPESMIPQPQVASSEKQHSGWLAALRLDLWKSPYRIILLVLFGFHLAQCLAIPIFPLYFVNELHLTDEQIGIGTAFFYLTVLLGSLQLNSLVRKIGHKDVMGVGALLMAVYPSLLAFSGEVWHFYAISAIGGLAWALAGGAIANYLLENIPANDRPAHLAWYTIIANTCVLAGSLIGPGIAETIGLAAALLLFGVLRLLSGFAILKFG